MNICKKKFGFVRKSGILMPLSSLPSPYGIGSCGKNAFEFIDFLDKSGQTCWQVLPLNPTSYGDSPYQSPASVAGNPYFIDLDILANEGLLTLDELEGAKYHGDRVDYGHLFNTRYPLLRTAYSRFIPNDDYNKFLKKNASWLGDYSLFMALKVHYNHCQWTLWNEEHRNITKAREDAGKFSEECGFWNWLQYEFMKQWAAVREYAHSKGILIIGDMPIYVAHDSMDVWRAPEQFLLDENFNPTVVAGCPPDGFSADGQLWGNPIYNWEYMQNDKMSWWIDRVKKNFAIYDILRIDHFRGFAGYYSIPYGEPTARNGKWNSAPGKELFKRIKRACPGGKIIAEDLGFITDDVRELLDYTGFPGMKMLHFAFYDNNSEYLPRTYTTDNCVVYASSHDSDCTKTWADNLSWDALDRFLKECKRRPGLTRTEVVIKLAMNSRANLAVCTMQDFLELTNDEGRINTPAVAVGNWTWRITPDYNTEYLSDKIYKFTKLGRRLKNNSTKGGIKNEKTFS